MFAAPPVASAIWASSTAFSRRATSAAVEDVTLSESAVALRASVRRHRRARGHGSDLSAVRLVAAGRPSCLAVLPCCL